MNALILIPARGGSKGIPYKNIKPLNGKPLICYSIDLARQISNDVHICVSTDDEEIKKTVEAYGLQVPFRRPAEFAGDNASMRDVIMHALNFYAEKGKTFEQVILLQPTSPLRTIEHVKECIRVFRENPGVDMVATVKDTDTNPYYLFEESDGYLRRLQIVKGIETRQHAPLVYQMNGAVYIINVNSLSSHDTLSGMPHIVKVKMEKLDSIDIDEMIDWYLCETILAHQRKF